MAKFLVVAHRTADSAELLAKVAELTRTGPEPAQFVVLTPIRPWTLSDWLNGERRTPIEIARWRTQRTRHRLEAIGADVVAARLGNFDPMVAIEEELKSGEFAGVIISTLAPGLSRWLGIDLPDRVSKRWPGLRVIHVTARFAYLDEPADRTPAPAPRDQELTRG